MADLADGETVEMKGSGAKPYQLKNVGGVYSCTCPAWRNQSTTIEKRTCKHLRKLRGDAAEEARIESALPARPLKPDGSEEVAELPVLLAHVWSEDRDPTGWWMSEKLDGVRAYWNGKQFLSRKNNIFYAPDWFTAGLPTHPLDGELWIACKQFDLTSGIVRRQDKPEIWSEVKYLVFDAPDAPGPFEDRMKFLTDSFGGWNAKFAALHEHALCTGLDHLIAELDRVTSLGGEGLMLREPGSQYERTRSTSLLKVKKFLDAEAVVIGHEAGAGRHKGRVGALVARFANGKEFKVGTGLKDKERENPPAVGSLITVKYQELTKDGIPRFGICRRAFRRQPARTTAGAKSFAETNNPRSHRRHNDGGNSQALLRIRRRLVQQVLGDLDGQQGRDDPVGPDRHERADQDQELRGRVEGAEGIR